MRITCSADDSLLKESLYFLYNIEKNKVIRMLSSTNFACHFKGYMSSKAQIQSLFSLKNRKK